MEMVEEAHIHDTFAVVDGDDDTLEQQCDCFHSPSEEDFSWTFPDDGKYHPEEECRHPANIFLEFSVTDLDTGSGSSPWTPGTGTLVRRTRILETLAVWTQIVGWIWCCEFCENKL